MSAAYLWWNEMSSTNFFRRRMGRGWLVLAGGLAADDQSVTALEAAMLNRTISQGPMAYIWAASDIETADQHMESLRDLGARTGYLIDILTEEEDEISRELGEAGIIVLGGGPRVDTLREALVGVVLQAVEDAFMRGATVYACGEAAALLGAFAVQPDRLIPGFHWVERALILPAYTSDQAEVLRGWVQTHADHFGLGLGHGAALALGPQGEVEVWGRPAVTVLLGQQIAPDESGFAQDADE